MAGNHVGKVFRLNTFTKHGSNNGELCIVNEVKNFVQFFPQHGNVFYIFFRLKVVRYEEITEFKLNTLSSSFKSAVFNYLTSLHKRNRQSFM